MAKKDKKELVKPRVDVLNREEFINQVLNVVSLISSNKGNMTFAINGSWGCGKTFVLNEIEKKLEQDTNSKYLVIHYNCWQFDYYDEPLVAIVSVFLDGIEKSTCISDTEKRKARTVLKQVAKSFLSIGSDILKSSTGVDIEKRIEEAKNILDSKDVAKKMAKEFDPYDNLKNALRDLVNELSHLTKKSTIVFCVDELDRCLPEYAIKVLERLHHLTENLQNIVSIISVDKSRLENTVNSIFGEKLTNPNERKITADDYLKKFIRFEMFLDKGKQDGTKFAEKYPDFVNRFDASLYTEIESTEQFIEDLFQGIDARSQEHIVDRAMLLNDICFGKEKQDHSIMYTELFVCVLYYFYKDDESFFDDDKKVTDIKNVFNCYSKIPLHFKQRKGGFDFSDATIVQGFFHGHGIEVNPSNIYMLVFCYWYYSVKQVPEKKTTNYYFPSYSNNNSTIKNNIEKTQKLVSLLNTIA